MLRLSSFRRNISSRLLAAVVLPPSRLENLNDPAREDSQAGRSIYRVKLTAVRAWSCGGRWRSRCSRRSGNCRGRRLGRERPPLACPGYSRSCRQWSNHHRAAGVLPVRITGASASAVARRRETDCCRPLAPSVVHAGTDGTRRQCTDDQCHRKQFQQSHKTPPPKRGPEVSARPTLERRGKHDRWPPMWEFVTARRPSSPRGGARRPSQLTNFGLSTSCESAGTIDLPDCVAQSATGRGWQTDAGLQERSGENKGCA